MNEYRIPEGRPRSVPPMSNGEVPHPAPSIDTLEGAIAAYVAGTPTNVLRKGLGTPAVRLLYDTLEERGLLRRGRYNKPIVAAPAAPPPPSPSIPEEPSSYRHSVLASFAREERACRVLCRRLNKSETDGQWMTARQTVERGLFKTLGGVPQRVRSSGWKRAKGAGVRLYIYFVPFGRKLARPPERPEAPIVSMVTPPLTWRQRFRRWLGF